MLDSPNSQAIDIVAGPRLLPIFKSQRALDDAGSAGLHSRHSASVVVVSGLFFFSLDFFLFLGCGSAKPGQDVHTARPLLHQFQEGASRRRLGGVLEVLIWW